MQWILVTYRLPTDQSRARVAVWREVRRLGALQVQQSLVAFPDTEAFRPAVERFRALVNEHGGSTLAMAADPLSPGDGERLGSAWDEARRAEYSELVRECEKFLAEIEHEFEIEKFTLAELEEEESELDKLQRWHKRIADRDVLGCSAAGEATAAMTRAEEALARYSSAVFERTQP